MKNNGFPQVLISFSLAQCYPLEFKYGMAYVRWNNEIDILSILLSLIQIGKIQQTHVIIRPNNNISIMRKTELMLCN